MNNAEKSTTWLAERLRRNARTATGDRSLVEGKQAAARRTLDELERREVTPGSRRR